VRCEGHRSPVVSRTARRSLAPIAPPSPRQIPAAPALHRSAKTPSSEAPCKRLHFAPPACRRGPLCDGRPFSAGELLGSGRAALQAAASAAKDGPLILSGVRFSLRGIPYGKINDEFGALVRVPRTFRQLRHLGAVSHSVQPNCSGEVLQTETLPGPRVRHSPDSTWCVHSVLRRSDSERTTSRPPTARPVRTRDGKHRRGNARTRTPVVSECSRAEPAYWSRSSQFRTIPTSRDTGPESGRGRNTRVPSGETS
jgi:hypothetical protein